MAIKPLGPTLEGNAFKAGLKPGQRKSGPAPGATEPGAESGGSLMTFKFMMKKGGRDDKSKELQVSCSVFSKATPPYKLPVS